LKSNNKIAFLIFADDPHIEASKKRFAYHAGQKTNRQVSAALNAAISRAAQLSGLPVIRIGSNLQRGANFGEKLANAFDLVFQKGYEKVIAVGNDCPELSVSILKHAVLILDQNEFVLGPAKDGGCYLIGITRSSFKKDSFAILPWQTPHLYNALVLHSNSELSSALPALRDLDTEADIFRSNPSLSLVRVIIFMIRSCLKMTLIKPFLYNFEIFKNLFQLRAPPIY
jgi:glycosyltransferase A (GT-A) superfamily protein (DUF2064 family)